MPETENAENELIDAGVTRPAGWFLPGNPPKQEDTAAVPGGYPAGPSLGRLRDASVRARHRHRHRRRALGLVELLVGGLVLAGLLVTATLVLPAVGRVKGTAAQEAGFAARPAVVNAGIFSQVATVGSTVVAAGTRAGGQPGFLVSRDGGRAWSQATLRSVAGPTAGHPATLVAGGPGGWTALGPRAIWTSPDGLTWTLDSAQGPGQAGDVVTAVTSTRSGFLATGTNAAAGTGLVWTSANGASWLRFTAAQFGLEEYHGDQVFRMDYATSSASRTLIVGAARVEGRTCWYVWLNGGGGEWTTVVVPMDHGGGVRFAGFGTSNDGFIAVRPGTTAAGRPDAVVYRSSNAVDWRFQATITDPAGFNPVRVTGSAGALAGFAIGGRDAQGNLVVDESMDNAVTWTPSRSIGQVPAGQSLGVAMLPDGTVVIAGAVAPGRSGQPQLLEVASQGTDPRTITLSSTR